MSSSPEFFKEGCNAFFGLESGPEDKVDSYWKVSRRMIYQSLFEAFENNWTLYIPKLIIPSGFSWLSYAQHLKNGVHSTHSTHSTPQLFEPEGMMDLPKSLILLAPPPNIGLTGEMGHGKSTVAAYLCQRHGYSEYSFARPLKEGLKKLFSFSDEQVYGEEKNQLDARWGVTPRYILQQIGTELFRNNLNIYLPQIKENNLDSGIWIRNFMRWIEHHPARVVISDCRFMDECLALHQVNIKVYRVVRESAVRPSHGEAHAHVSEKFQNLLPVDGELLNIGTLEELYNQVDNQLIAVV